MFPGTAGIYLAEKLTTEGNAIIREFSEGGGAIVCALIVGSPAWFSGAETKPAQLTYKQAIFAKKSDYPSTSVEMPVENQDKYLSLWDAGALWWIYHTYVAYWDDYSAKFVQKKIDELNENSKTVYELVRYPIGSVACDDEGHISIIQTMRSPIYFFKCG